MVEDLRGDVAPAAEGGEHEHGNAETQADRASPALRVRGQSRLSEELARRARRKQAR